MMTKNRFKIFFQESVDVLLQDIAKQLFNPRPTKGDHCDPPSIFFPVVLKRRKITQKSFYVIVSSSFALILMQKPWG